MILGILPKGKLLHLSGRTLQTLIGRLDDPANRGRLKAIISKGSGKATLKASGIQDDLMNHGHSLRTIPLHRRGRMVQKRNGIRNDLGLGQHPVTVLIRIRNYHRPMVHSNPTPRALILAGLAPAKWANRRTKKKRGRPFGSKNKPKLPHDANPLDSQQSLPAPPKASPKKLRRVSTEEVGVNTSISLHVNSEVTLRAADDDPPLPVFTFLPPAVMKGKKIIGPYVKVDTNKTKQPMYSIVNVRKKAEEDKGQPKNMTANSQARTLQRRPSFIGAAKKRIIPNLANNDTSRDSSWVCILCKNGPHHRELGDLYGPYSIRLDRLEEDHPSSNDAQRSRNSRSPRRKNSIDGEKSDRNKTDYDQQQEIWFHEDCISWSSGVYLIGSRMNNMEETIKDSLDTVCTRCSLNGANLGCLQKGCSSRFHFLCAKDQGCDMDEDNFSIFCPKHKHATSPPTIL
ncbi:Retinoic acid-induced protein 1 [Halotydeus destructor]|nr:Retinoic acid-induced protein 1 [Halotydeus destructor]